MDRQTGDGFKIAIVGPTNVGKSTLFNRLTGTRKAIVCDRPGVTVDRHEFLAPRTPVGPVSIVDTGGVGPQARSHALGIEIERAAAHAVGEADLILFVVDGTQEVGVEELEVAEWLRQLGPKAPVWILANKRDAKRFDGAQFYSLGFDRLFEVSAEHDTGILEVWEAVAEMRGKLELGEELQTVPHVDDRILILGRPNVGKSTLLNALLGEERAVVSPMPGTTRDTIEGQMQHHGLSWILCDTAGQRRPGRLERDVEWVAREKLKDAARSSSVAILMINAEEGVSDLDAAIGGMAADFGLSLVIAVNKWDRVKGDLAIDMVNKLERTDDLKLDFLRHAPRVRISALTGKGIPELLKKIEVVAAARRKRVSTGRLNRFFEDRIRLHSHPLGPMGRPAKFYYLSQVDVSPPRFVLFTNLPPGGVHFSFKRYLANCLREEFDLNGAPIELHFKQAHNRGESPAGAGPRDNSRDLAKALAHVEASRAKSH